MLNSGNQEYQATVQIMEWELLNRHYTSEVPVVIILEGDRPTVKLEGSFDRHSAPEIRNKLLGVIREKSIRLLDIDLSAVTSMDTAGIAVLVEILRSLSYRNGELKLKGLDEKGARMVQLARLHQIFKINQDLVK